MAIAYSVTERNNRLTQILNVIDGGATGGLLSIYDGTRPATGGAVTTLLAQFVLPKPSGTIASGVYTFNAIPGVNITTTGTATWARFTDSASTFAADVNVGTSGSDINFNSVAFSSGAAISITSATITEGNP